jgi:predicted enzyme related to lactoylglutathione lyase
MAENRASHQPKSRKVFGHPSRRAKTPFRVALYARVSTQDQQTIPLQMRALREYAGRRGWAVAVQVKEISTKSTRACCNGAALLTPRRSHSPL